MVNLWLVIIAVVATLVLLGASFVPAPGLVGYNVRVTVESQELSLLIANYFSISSVSGTTTGAATLLDWGAWLSTAPFAVEAQFGMTVCVATSHCETLTASQWFPTVPFVNGATLSATNTFSIAQVPSGSQPISVTLTQNGQTVATGSATMCVGC